MRRALWVVAACVLAGTVLLAAEKTESAAPGAADKASADAKYWVEPMRKVHAKFTGEKGTFAHFGDSITVSMAFWSSLKWSQKNMDEAAQADFDLVKKSMKDACWNQWKGPAYGNDGGMTIRWAYDNIDKWLEKLNPEVALLMFGTNDVGQVPVDEYEKKTREVVQKCLDKGTVVILSTIPPKHGQDEKVKALVEAARRVARDLKVPLSDYYEAIMSRRPDDWDGASAKFKDTPGDVYQVETPISRDGVHPSNPKKWEGDYSAEGLKNSGFVLRNYVVLRSYAEVLRGVLKADAKAPAAGR